MSTNVDPSLASWKIMRDGGHNIARLTCARCPAHADITLGTHMPPEFIVKKFQQKGMYVDPKRSDRCFCTECFQSRKRDIDKVRGKATMKEVFPKELINGAAASPPSETLKLFKAEKAESVIDISPAPLSSMKRAEIRAMLESFFDDKTGRYLDGYSDKKIAEEIGISWKQVEAVRELAYGELKSDPELDMLKQRVADMRVHIDAALVVESDIYKRIREIEKRMGISAP